VSTAEAPVSDAEAGLLFADLIDQPVLVLAVSGGPDSTALLVLAARWRKRAKRGPKLFAVTVDHGLRAESKREAAAVKRLAARLGIPHRTLRWTGAKPVTGLQRKAREARYRLIGAAARRAGAACVLTAHTLDDQAETLLFRMARGSGLTGLAGMAPARVLSDLLARDEADAFAVDGADASRHDGAGAGLALVRPLLGIPKARLIATLRAAKVPFADDPSNHDPRFTRTRLRALMPALAGEGLDARRFALLARRLRRADAVIELAVDAAAAALAPGTWPARGPIVFEAEAFARVPAEVGLRLLGRAIAAVGDEGPVRLGKLEALTGALAPAIAADVRLRRTLAGALVTLDRGRLTVERAPARRNREPSAKSSSSGVREAKKARFTTQR